MHGTVQIIEDFTGLGGLVGKNLGPGCGFRLGSLGKSRWEPATTRPSRGFNDIRGPCTEALAECVLEPEPHDPELD
jgi:hypothetical protein